MVQLIKNKIDHATFEKATTKSNWAEAKEAEVAEGAEEEEAAATRWW